MCSGGCFVKFFMILIFVNIIVLPGFSQGVYTWSGGSGNWSDPTMWSPNGTPAAGDTAIVYTGTITLPAIAAVGGLYHNGGILYGSGILTISGKLIWKGGRIEGGETVEVAAGASLKISGSSNKEINAGMLINNGSGVWDDAGEIGFRNGAQFINSANAVFEIRGDGRLDPLIPGAGSFINFGTLSRNAGSGTNTIDIDFSSNGPIIINSGKILLKKTSSITGVTVTLGGGELEFNSGSHSLNDVSFEGSGKVNIVDAPLTIQNSGSNFAPDIDLDMLGSNSVFTVNGETVVKGTFEWNRGIIAGSSTLTIDGLLKITGSNARKLDCVTLRSKEQAIWSGSGSIRMFNGAEFKNSNGGDLDIQTDAVVEYLEPGGGSFINSGTMTKSGGIGSLLIKVNFENNKTINIESGKIELIKGGSSDDAIFNINAGCLLDFNGGDQNFDNVTFSGNGQVSFSKNTITVAAGGVTLDASVTATMSAGELACNGPFINNGTLYWASGIISGSEALTSNGEFRFNTTNYVNLSGQTIDNHGLLTWETPGTIKLTNSAKIINRAGATFDIQSDGLLDFVLAENGGSLFNAGTMTKSGGSGISYIDAEFTNTGTVNTHSGILRFERGSTDVSDGVFHTSAGNVLVLSERPFIFDNTQFTGDGTVSVEDAILHVNGNGIIIEPSLTFSMVHDNAVIDGNGAVNCQGTLIWDRGTFSGTGELKINGALHFSSDHLKILNGKRLSNQNIITLNGNSTIHLEEFAEIVNQAGATFTIDGNPTFNFLGTQGGSIQNAGAIYRNSGTGTTAVGVEFNNSGLTEIHSGTLKFTGPITNETSGEIRGTGTLDLLLASFNNHGSVCPGTSIGNLAVTGDYVQQTDGKLNIELGGYTPSSEYDQLLVAGATNLNGILNINLEGNFNPDLGQQFTIVNSITRNGQFTQVNGPTISGLPVFEVNYGASKVMLTVIRQSMVLTAVNDYGDTAEENPIELNVLRNDNASQGNHLSIAGFTQPLHGMAAQMGDSTLFYLPVENFFGVDSFFYSITDESNAQDIARVLITVLPVNDPPTISGLPDISFPEDSSQVLDLTLFANDVDNIVSELNWNATVISAQFPGVNLHPAKNAFAPGMKKGGSGIEVDPGDLQISIDPLTHLATFTATGDTSGIFTVRFSVSDPAGLFDRDTIIVIVQPVGDLPVVANPIADVSLPEDDGWHLVSPNLNQVFSDPDPGTVFTFSAVSENPDMQTFLSGDSLRIISSPDYFGSGNIVVSASDGARASVNDTFLVTVLPVNDPPAINGLPDISFPEDSSQVLDLTLFANDVDNIVSELNWNVAVISAQFAGVNLHPATNAFAPEMKEGGSGIEVDPGDLQINIDSLTHLATFTATGDTSGIFTVEFTLSDPAGLFDRDTITVTVQPVGDLPFVANPIADVSLPEDNGWHLVSPILNQVFSDPDPGTVFTFSAVSENPDIDALISGDSLRIISSLNYFGSGNIVVSANDGIRASVSDTFSVTILPVNDPPTISGLPPSLTFDNDSSVAINVWEFVDDVETADSLLAYEFFASNDSLLSDYNAQAGSLLLSAIPGFGGEASLLIRVIDPENASVEDTIFVIVNPVIIVGIANWLPGQVPQEFALQQNFPNPFNPNTTIKFQIPETGEVRLAVYNILGQKVRTLMNERLNAGYYQVSWDGLNDQGRQMASGIYIYRIQAGNFLMVRKMTLMR